MDHTYAVILAGGGGTRLWPVSRRKQPKHILPLLGKATLFQSTVSRLEGLVEPGKILVVTASGQAGELNKQVPQVPEANFLNEPQPRGTAAAIGLAAWTLTRLDPQAVMLVLPSDHFIRNRDRFRQVMRLAVQVAGGGYLVTLGITPAFPSTGYGYIQHGEILPGNFETPVYRVLRFTEKPDEKKARVMLAGGDHTWNSGMFVWRAEAILTEIARQMPGLKAALDHLATAWGQPEQEAVFTSEWKQLKPETIDYGIMEKAGKVAVIPAGDLDWSDIGSWDVLFDVLSPDRDGNVVAGSGGHLPLETHNTLVFSIEKKLVVTVGVSDLLVIETGDALLVCHRDHAQQVRQVIEKLKEMGKEEYL